MPPFNRITDEDSQVLLESYRLLLEARNEMLDAVTLGDEVARNTEVIADGVIFGILGHLHVVANHRELFAETDAHNFPEYARNIVADVRLTFSHLNPKRKDDRPPFEPTSGQGSI